MNIPVLSYYHKIHKCRMKIVAPYFNSKLSKCVESENKVAKFLGVREALRKKRFGLNCHSSNGGKGGRTAVFIKLPM